MKTVFLNDTTSADHVGCELVMVNSLTECERVGIEVMERWTTADCKEPIVDRLPGESFDGLLINGEGSMHHDRPVATHLCQAAEWAKGAGKKVVLYNTMWEANERLGRYLGAFDRIYCRDSASAQEIREAGGRCEVVPDMVFASRLGDEPPREQETPEEVIVIDSIDRKKSERLSKFAQHHGFPFLHMDRIGYERAKKRLFVRAGWFPDRPDIADEFVERVRRGRRVLSGRFHGTCIAMVLGLPVVSVGSKTRKLEALHRDVCPDNVSVWAEVPKRKEDLDEAFARAEESLLPAGDYVERARATISETFDEIAVVFGD